MLETWRYSSLNPISSQLFALGQGLRALHAKSRFALSLITASPRFQSTKRFNRQRESTCDATRELTLVLTHPRRALFVESEH